ncbi:MAG: hypothetical protein Q9187_009046, partial [Circinaria calcarea]
SIPGASEQAVGEDTTLPTIEPSHVIPPTTTAAQASAASVPAPLTPPPLNYPWAYYRSRHSPGRPAGPLNVPSLMSVPLGTVAPLATPRIPPPPASARLLTAPPSPRIGRPWSQAERDTVAGLLREVMGENVGRWLVGVWEVVAQRLEPYHFSNPPRTANALRVFWVRHGREEYGIDERRSTTRPVDETEKGSDKAAKRRKRRLGTPSSPPPTKYRKHDEHGDDDDGKEGDLQMSGHPALPPQAQVPAGYS